jgi:hypothetical protein
VRQDSHRDCEIDFTVKSATRSSATGANGLSIAKCAMGHSVGDSKVTSYCKRACRMSFPVLSANLCGRLQGDAWRFYNACEDSDCEVCETTFLGVACKTLSTVKSATVVLP